MQHLKYLYKFLWKHRVKLLIGTFFVLVSNIFALYPAEFVRKAFDQYTSVYSGILQNNDPVSTWTTKVQKTKAGGGYHQWHCENGQFLYRDRVLAWMVYLNTVPSQNGGGTDFLHQKLTLQPEAGTIVLWPASYTHVHRGGFLTGNVDKYIATGWFIREPT